MTDTQEQVPHIASLAPAWDKPIPPQAVRIIDTRDPVSGRCSTRPEWNPEWLVGLEQFVRSVVRDELDKARKVWEGGPR